MSVFLMGVYDKEKQKFCTVTKCGNGHDDATLDRINKDLEPKVINISNCTYLAVYKLQHFFLKRI